MNRPVIGLVLALALSIKFASPLYAQAVSIIHSTGSTPAALSTSSVTPSASPMDFSAMNWRFGLVSPYAQQPISGSVTTQATVPPPSEPTNTINNPFVSGALGTQGSLISTESTGTGSSTGASPITVASSGSSTGTAVIPSYAPRFISFNTLEPNFGVTTPLTPVDAGLNLNLLTPSGAAGNPSSIPEPGTLLLCGGLLAVIGYGYSRRRLKPENKTEVPPVVAPVEVETNESACV